MSALEYQDIWPLLQEDIAGVIQADTFLGARPIVVIEPGSIQSNIDAALARIIGKGNDGKLGVGCLVLPIERAEDEDISSPAGPLKLDVTVQWVENVTINRSAQGTTIPIRIYAARCAKLLKLYTPVGLAQSLVSKTPIISEFTEPTNKALRVGQVDFYAREADGSRLIRLDRPLIATGNLEFPYTVSITQPNAAVLYYTTDGSHPWAGNKAAQIYSGPVTINEPCLLRARAFGENTDHTTIGSDTAAKIFPTTNFS